jgi:hypothetical protein
MKSSKNNAILNKMRNESYTKKEGVYAQLIINVLDESNKLSRKLSNVYVNHNIIEKMLLNKDMYFLHDYFGRSENEFSPAFIKASKALNKQFNKDYPKASGYTADYRTNYYTNDFFGVRVFMRKVILKIIVPLKIKSIVQPNFVSLSNTERNGKTLLWMHWYSGKRQGNYMMNEEYSIDRKLTKSEILKLQTKIETAANLNHEEIIDCDVVQEIIDTFLQNQKQKSELIFVS